MNCCAEWFVIPAEELSATIKSAENNDMEAMTRIFMHYIETENRDLAIKWAKRGAERGYSPQINFLVELYWTGNMSGIKNLSVIPDKKEALKWLKILVDSGDEHAKQVYNKLKSEM